MTGTQEYTVRPPYQIKSWTEVRSGNDKGTDEYVLNGNRGWEVKNGTTQALSRKAMLAIRASLRLDYMDTLLPLRDARYRLTLIPETKVNGRPAVGLRVAESGWRPDTQLYFDKETGLRLN